MARIGNISLTKIFYEDDDLMKCCLAVNDQYAGYVIVVNKDNSAKVELVLESDFEKLTIAEARKAMSLINKNYDDEMPDKTILCLLTSQLIALRIKERDFIDIRDAFQVDNYLEITYENGNNAILPLNNISVLNYIGLMLKNVKDIKDVRLINSDSFVISEKAIKKERTNEKFMM